MHTVLYVIFTAVFGFVCAAGAFLYAKRTTVKSFLNQEALKASAVKADAVKVAEDLKKGI